MSRDVKSEALASLREKVTKVCEQAARIMDEQFRAGIPEYLGGPKKRSVDLRVSDQEEGKGE